jgi:hypothetical protein
MTDNRPVINENFNDEAYKAPVNEVNDNNKVSGETVEGKEVEAEAETETAE